MADSPHTPISFINHERNIMESSRIEPANPHTTLNSGLQDADSQTTEIETIKRPYTVSTPPPSSPRPNFLTLPIELRYQIYNNIVAPTSGTIDLQLPAGKLNHHTFILLNTSNQIRNETLYIIYNDIPLALSLWNYPKRKHIIEDITATWSYLFKSLWRGSFGTNQMGSGITSEEIKSYMTPHEKTNAITLDPGSVAKFRDVTIKIDVDEDILRYAALEEGMQIWLGKLLASIPNPSPQRRQIMLDFRYNSGDSGFSGSNDDLDEEYIPPIPHPQGLPRYSREEVEGLFERLVLKWRDIHIGIYWMIAGMEEAPVGIEVLVKTVNLIDGVWFEFVEEGDTIEGRFTDLGFDEQDSEFGVDGGSFVFIGGKLSELKCNFV
ncbi:hypothetical protein E6O75_ATG04335 [Venturia nashicola]|uniref:Uncharacterized protein n=1 Tax=Venturia nashicola TaxID=86259 RepID=A0A4Z1PN30_9PEZI|nr:hypothetical protein E6O75_ATG04335 [Venturia nashicola]